MLSPYMSPIERVWFYSLRILCGLILFFKARIHSAEPKKSWYQCSEKPCNGYTRKLPV